MGTALASAGLATMAEGYHGPPELTVARAFTEWTFDPWMAALVVILGVGYLAGVRRQKDWPVARRIWFLGIGLGFLVIATMSFIGVYQPVLFYVRAIQTVAHLDAREAAVSAAEPDGAGKPGEPQGTRPWWEDDPRFTGRFRAT